MFKPMAVSRVNVSIFKRDTQQQAAILYLPEFLCYSAPPSPAYRRASHVTKTQHFQAAMCYGLAGYIEVRGKSCIVSLFYVLT